ncbi:MAG TPA: hypothetical protein VEB19_05175 [Gemmatimonadaceae bacterium]|nr:hypothetical protein [Gemmatimonadaceae bacterium]
MRAAVFVLLLLSACGSPPPEGELRLLSENYAFRISPSESPPRAREATLYKIIVLDRESREPIETGEGQIFANNEERAGTWDGFAKGAELGTYYGKLNFVTAGTWAIAIRFRRDSLHRLERVEWVQDVLNERPTATP